MFYSVVIYIKQAYLSILLIILEFKQKLIQNSLIITKYKQTHFQMRFFKKLKKMVEMTDFFNSTQMLRYENQNQYRTFTGGVLSLGIIVTIIIGFASMILDTLNLSSIAYTQNIITRTVPSLTTITTSPDNNFMFGIEIWHQNLSSSVRYFDVVIQQYVENASINNPVDIQMVQCTKQHWASMPNLVDSFDKLQVSGWLCPPIGAHYDIVGKYTSDFYKQLVFTVAPCNNATDPSRPCASQTEIDQLFIDNGDWFYFTFYYINTIINPDQPSYKNYYLEDSAYIIFGKQLGVESYLYIADFDIVSDYSIWPFTNQIEDVGFMTQGLPTNHGYTITASNQANYVTFCVAKSSNSIVYSRQVQKLSTVFSFMGGLIGALMAGLFVINSYTSFAFQISIALAVFKKDHPKQGQQYPSTLQNPHMVNFIQFIQYHWYALKKYFLKDYKDNHFQHIYQCRKEILRQLDIKSIIKRIVFLQYSMTYIFTDYQLQGLQLHKPTDPLDVKSVRKRIQNIDLADLESDFSLDDSKNKEMIDILEPHTAFNLGDFLKSSKVANLHSPATNLPNIDTKASQTRRQYSKEVVFIQSVRSISMQEHQSRIKMSIEKKKTQRLQNLISSAKEGNQLSKRICQSIHTIKQIIN